MDKDALYLEVDEDITSAIDKLKRAPGSSISIVVPKRSTILQSVINLKLLQKAANTAGKQLVLVTNDRVAKSLAGRVGLAVADTLGGKAAKPEMEAPAVLAADEVIDESTDFDETTAAAAVAPVAAAKAASTGKRAAAPAAAPVIARREVADEADESVEAAPAAAAAGAVAADKSAKATRGPKVPDFTKLQRRLLWVGGAVAVVIAYLAAMYYFTTAKVTLYAAGTKAEVTAHIVADPNLNQSDTTAGTLAAQLIKADKDLSNTFVPTGSKDVGERAGGTVSLQNCEDSNVYPLSQGFALTSQGLNFTTDAPVNIPPGTFSNGGKTCTSPKVTVHITAALSGDKYNLTNANFSSSKLTPNFNISGSMSGGTTKTVKVVVQADIDKAKAALLDSDKATEKELVGKVPSGYMAVPSSFSQQAGEATATPAAGEQAEQASLAMHITDSVLGVTKSDYHDAVRAQETKAIGEKYQLYEDGLASATVTAGTRDSSGRQTFQVVAEVSGGPKIDIASITQAIKGRKYGAATDYLSKVAGVQRSEITLWPSWQSSLPKRGSNIKVTINVISGG